MSLDVLIVLLGWLVISAIFLGCILFVRYLQHRERMALITKGIHPHTLQRQRRSRGLLRAGLITMMVGVSLTVGLYPIGFFFPASFPNTPLHLGPWLLPGLIPLGVGVALVVSYYLEHSSQPPLKEEEDSSKIIPIAEHRTDRERQENS